MSVFRCMLAAAMTDGLFTVLATDGVDSTVWVVSAYFHCFDREGVMSKGCVDDW